VLTHYSGLESGYFDNSAYAFAHPDYPILLPAFEALHFRAAGRVDTQAVHLHLWLLLVAFAWAMAYVASHVVRPLVWAPLVLAAVLAPSARDLVMAAYADAEVALFLGLGVLALGIWIEARERAWLALSALMLAAAASTKNEGLMGAVVALACAAALLAIRRDRAGLRGLGVVAGLFAVAVLPWRVWVAAHGISGDLPVGKGLRPGYLADRADRVWPSVKALYGQLADQGKWHMLVPLALALALVGLASRRLRPLAAFYIATGALTFALVVWAFWISPSDLDYQITTSQDRVVAAVIAVSLAASLHLVGALTALTEPPPKPPRRRRGARS
jgi:hypothetical protein